MIPGKAHQNAEAERNGSREEIITGLRISKRPRSLVECLQALFMPEDCFRLPTKSDEVFFFITRISSQTRSVNYFVCVPRQPIMMESSEKQDLQKWSSTSICDPNK